MNFLTGLAWMSWGTCLIRCYLLQFQEILIFRSSDGVQVQSGFGVFFRCVTWIHESIPWSLAASKQWPQWVLWGLHLFTHHLTYHQQWVLIAVWLISDPVLISHHHIFLPPVLVPTVLSLVLLKAYLEVKICMQVQMWKVILESKNGSKGVGKKSRKGRERVCDTALSSRPHCRWLMLEPVLVKSSFMIINSFEILGYIRVANVFPQMPHTPELENPQNKKWEHTVQVEALS